MIELPEAAVLAHQINDTVSGKKISNVIAGQNPHKYAFFCGDPKKYDSLLSGKTIGTSTGFGAMVEINAGLTTLLVSEGVNLRYIGPDDQRPAKHQLLIEFEDGSAMVGSVQMYGGLWAFQDGRFDNPYYLMAKEKISPLNHSFDYSYFQSLLKNQKPEKLSAKAFLATEQRIPGLGNGVLQDILWTARIHPRRKMAQLSTTRLEGMFNAVKSVLSSMTAEGGRDTERDLFGFPGKYKTILCKNTADKPCPTCGTLIKKEAYMGGSIYYCEHCQEL